MSKGKGKARRSAPDKQRRGLLWFLPWALAAIPISVVLWPSVFLTAALLSPSLLAYMLLGRGQAHLIVSIGILNLAGVLPALVRLWRVGHDAGVALGLLADPLVWGSALAGACAGLGLVFVTEWLVAAYYRLTAETRLQDVMARQAAIVELWGDEVISAEASRLMAESGQDRFAGREDDHEAAA